MKAFDLKAAQEGAAVVTRDGRAARIVCTDMKGDSSVIALVERPVPGEEDKREEVCLLCNRNGLCRNVPENGRNDLFLVPVQKSGWVALFEYDGKVVCGSTVSATEAEAREYSSQKLMVGDKEAVCVGINEVTWSE